MDISSTINYVKSNGVNLYIAKYSCETIGSIELIFEVYA